MGYLSAIGTLVSYQKEAMRLCAQRRNRYRQVDKSADSGETTKSLPPASTSSENRNNFHELYQCSRFTTELQLLSEQSYLTACSHNKLLIMLRFLFAFQSLTKTNLE